MYNKAWCTCRVVVLLIKPIAFLTFSLPSPSQFRKRRRRRLRKRHLKSEFALVQTLFRLFHLVLFRQMFGKFLEVEPTEKHSASAKRIAVCNSLASSPACRGLAQRKKLARRFVQLTIIVQVTKHFKKWLNNTYPTKQPCLTCTIAYQTHKCSVADH